MNIPKIENFLEKFFLGTKKFLIFGLIFGSVILTQASAEAPDMGRGEYLIDPDYRFKAYIPYGWDKEVSKKEQSLRLELFSAPRTFIITEIYKDFDKSLFNYKNVVWRRQKIKFHTMEKIIDKTFKKNGIRYFLAVSKFRHEGRTYLQRTYGKQIGSSAYVVNFIAPSASFYKKLPVFNAYISRFQFNVEAQDLEIKKEEGKVSQAESKFSDEKLKPANILSLEGKKDEGRTAKKKDQAKTDKKDDAKKNEFSLLPDGSWGYN